MKASRILLLPVIAMLFSSAHAQVELKEKTIPVDISLELKSAHIWRGLDVAQNFLIDANIRLMDKSNTFAVGIWGASTFSKDFREFDYYVGFYKGGFSLEIWDIFNFSEKNQYNAITNPGGYNTEKAFDYSAHGTGHFIDLQLAYQFPERFPLRLGWNTVIFGRDRKWVTDGSGVVHYSNSQYSTYVSADYPVLSGNIVDVSLGIAGSFALRDAKIDGERIKGHFYGTSDGIVNVNLKVSKTLKFGKVYQLPITGTVVWNPEASKTYLELAFNVLQF